MNRRQTLKIGDFMGFTSVFSKFVSKPFGGHQISTVKDVVNVVFRPPTIPGP